LELSVSPWARIIFEFNNKKQKTKNEAVRILFFRMGQL